MDCVGVLWTVWGLCGLVVVLNIKLKLAHLVVEVQVEWAEGYEGGARGRLKLFINF